MDRVHGWMSLSEFVALVVMVVCAIAALVFAIIAGANWFFDRPASLWWWIAAANAAGAFAGWLFL